MKSSFPSVVMLLSLSMAQGMTISAQNNTNTLSIVDATLVAYSGAITDSESQLQYLNARYYQARLLRFVSWDSFDLMNRFAYANGNPVMNEDPSGHYGLAEYTTEFFGRPLKVDDILTLVKSADADAELLSYPVALNNNESVDAFCSRRSTKLGELLEKQGYPIDKEFNPSPRLRLLRWNSILQLTQDALNQEIKQTESALTELAAQQFAKSQSARLEFLRSSAWHPLIDLNEKGNEIADQEFRPQRQALQTRLREAQQKKEILRPYLEKQKETQSKLEALLRGKERSPLVIDDNKS